MNDPDSAYTQPKALLRDIFRAAVEAVHPDRLMDIDLPLPPSGRTIVLGAGKAAAAMARAFERRWPGTVEGLVVTRYGHACDTEHVEVVEASHPVPDDEGVAATRRILALAQSAGENDLVVVLVSGGASALLAAPVDGLTLAEKQEINRALLKSGAPISEMNRVRRKLSAVKGGKLAAMIEPARSVTLVISDVAGDDPAIVGSGPTVPDHTPGHVALQILDRYGISASTAVKRILEHADGVESLNPLRHEVRVIGGAQSMLRAAARFAEGIGLDAVILGDDFEIDASALASVHASLARQVLRPDSFATPPCVLLSGGETSVTVRGGGRGGRNGQFLLALALALNGIDGVFAVAGDSDGIDGTEDNAGGIIDPGSLDRARRAGLDPVALLRDDDSYRFFDTIGDLLVTGPTLTNVNDFRAVFVRRTG